MSTRWILGFALFLGLALTASLYLSRGTHGRDVALVQQAPAGLRWRAGNTQHYSFLVDSSVRIGVHGTLPAEPVVQRATGRLELRTLQTGPVGVTVGMRLSPVDLTIAGASDPETNAALAAPFRARFSESGALVDFEFPERLDSRHAALMEELLRSFQVTIRDEVTWTAEEAHGSGSYLAEYVRSDEARCRKTKLCYQEHEAAEVAPPRARVLSSTASIRLDPDCDWIAGMQVDETLRVEEQAGVSVEVTTRATLELLPPSSRPPAAPESLWEFAAGEPLVLAVERSREVVPTGRSRAQLEQALATDLAALDAASASRSVWIHRLRDLLLEADDLASALLGAMEDQELEDRTRADLFFVFELAGTDAAQRALCRVVAEPLWSQRDGTRALVALGGLEAPTAATLGVLWTSSRYRSSPEATDHANTAALALGNLGNRLFGEGLQAYADLRNELTSAAWAARDAHERSIFVTALGNTGDPSLAPEILPFMEDGDVLVRTSAARTLGKLGIDEVASELVQQLRQEPSSRVRAAIAGSLSSWTAPSQEAMSSMREVVRAERDDATRLNMAQFLGRHLAECPENRSALQGLLETEGSKQIRRYLGEALARQ